MAVALQTRRPPTRRRRPISRYRADEREEVLPLVILSVLVAGVAALLLSGQLARLTVPRGLAASLQPAAQHRPIDGVAPATMLSPRATESAPADAGPSPADAAAPAPVALTVGGRARVANTDNLGVILHAAPRPNARQPAGLLEGASVTILELSGTEWARVQSDTKKTGWVRAAYLAPLP